MKTKLLIGALLVLLAPVFVRADDSVGGPAGTFISQILDEGTNLTRRSKVNFTGAGITCVDNSTDKRLDCTITTSGSGGSSATSLVVRYNGVLVSSPTSTIDFLPPLIVTLQGSTSAQVSLSKISLSTGVVGSVDISTQTNLTVVSPLILTNDTLSISAISLSTGVVGPLIVSSGTVTDLNTTTLKFNDGTTQNTAAVTSAGDITAVTAGTGMTGGGTVGAVTLNVDPAYSGFIHNQLTVQTGVTAYPEALLVGTSGAQIHGPLNADGIITASGTAITTAAGLLDATKLTGFVPNASIDESSITKKGNAFNTANKLLLLDGSGLVPDANLSTNVSLLGSSIDISAETNLSATAPLAMVGDNVTIDTSTLGGFQVTYATGTINQEWNVAQTSAGIKPTLAGPFTATNNIRLYSTFAAADPFWVSKQSYMQFVQDQNDGASYIGGVSGYIYASTGSAKGITASTPYLLLTASDGCPSISITSPGGTSGSGGSFSVDCFNAQMSNNAGSQFNTAPFGFLLKDSYLNVYEYGASDNQGSGITLRDGDEFAGDGFMEIAAPDDVTERYTYRMPAVAGQEGEMIVAESTATSPITGGIDVNTRWSTNFHVTATSVTSSVPIYTGDQFTDQWGGTGVGFKQSRASANGTGLAVNIDASAITGGANIFEVYQFGSLAGSIAYSDLNPAGLYFKDSSGNFKARWSFDGTTDIGSLFSYNNPVGLGGAIGVKKGALGASQTLDNTYFIVLATPTASTGDVTYSFPNIGSVGFGNGTYTLYRICKMNSSTNTVTFAAPGSGDSLDTNTVLRDQNECVEYYGDHTNPASSTGIWKLVSHTGQKGPEVKTKAQLQTDAPPRAGAEYYCSDCTVDGVVVSTGTAAGAVGRISARTTAIQ